MTSSSHYLLKNTYAPTSETGAGLVDVEIKAGHILALQPAGTISTHPGAQVIDAQGLWVLPGLVDLSFRLCAQGSPSATLIAQELDAAVAGGITTAVVPPDTQPVLDEAGLVEMLVRRVEACHSTRVLPLGALTKGLKGIELAPLRSLAQAGCIGFTQALHAIDNLENLRRAMLYARSFDYPLWLYPHDAHLGRGGVAHQSVYSSRLGLGAWPSVAETVALQSMLELVRATGARVHFCRLSTARSVELIRAAKAEGLPISADVAIAQLSLNEFDVGYFNTAAKLHPPLRGQSDQAALSAGVIDGTIDAICSDHHPVQADHKRLPFGEAQAGASAAELLLPLTLAWAQQHKVAPALALAKISAHPAHLLGSTADLNAGASADLCLWNPAPTTTVRGANFLSRGQHTPFEGQLLAGQVSHTFVGGRVVFARAA